MKLQEISVINKAIPLCFVNENVLLIAKNNKLFLYNIETNKKELLFSLKISIFKKLLSSNKYFFRLLRMGVRYSVPINNDNILIIFNNQFFELDIRTKHLSKTFDIPRGNRPLNISKVEGIEGFDNSFYFGEYFLNPDNKPVHIYKRKKDASWEIVYTFHENTIEHIHNIIPDKYNQCVWILVGDFGKAAGIWKATNNFETVEPILFGKQYYRSCVAFPTQEGLLYATDSQFEENAIRIMKNDGLGWKSELIQKINGPVIYGSKVKDNFYFATSVEGGDTSGLNKFQIMFDRKRGQGIKNENITIVGGNLKKGFECIYLNKKDRLPFYLFQLGTIIFPTGINVKDLLFFYNIATTDNDLGTSIFKIIE